MKITVPISTSDIHRLPDFLDVIEKLGQLEGHEVIFIPQMPCVPEAHLACARISKLTTSSVIPMNKMVAPGWPKSCNAQFQFTAFQMAIDNPVTPWFWMELDALPVKPGWAGALAGEYSTKGGRFLGNIVETQFKSDDGKFYTIPGDEMMLGVAVYHQALGRTDCLLKDLIAVDEPWDMYMRYDFKNFGWANSSVIADMWNTQNYRMEGDDLLCDPAPRDIDVARPRGGAVPKSAYIIHGCKDSSLADIILCRNKPLPDAGTPIPDPPTPPIIPPPVASATASASPATVITVDCTEIDVPVDLGDVKVPISDKEWISERLKEGSLRVGFVAKDWNCETTEARKRVEAAGFVISGPGWIKPKK